MGDVLRGRSECSGSTSGPGDSGEETAAEVPDFQRDIVPILLVSCGGSGSLCHARNAYAPAPDQGCRGWVSFEDQPLGSSFDDLDPSTNGPPEGPVDCPDLGLHERRDRLESWARHHRKLRVELGDRHRVRQVALVVLHDQGHVSQVAAVRGQAALEVLERRDVRLGTQALRIGDEHDLRGPRHG